MTVSPDVARVLAAAADVIEECGWMQGGYTDGERFCISGAIREVTGSGRFKPLTHLCAKAHTEVWRFFPEGIADWNDVPGRTKAEVVAKLREVAAS